MLTKSDLKAIKKVVNESTQNLDVKLANNTIKFKDEILKELENLRAEIIMMQGDKDQIEDHDQRIQKLEKTVYT